MARFGAMILSGGASLRMGQDKGAADWAGRRAVDRVAILALSLGSELTITVGRTDYGLPFIADEPPLGGPVGGVLAGAARLLAAGVARALILAVDAPTIRPADLQPLMSAEGPGVAFEGLPLPMLVDLPVLPADARPDWSMRRLVEQAGLGRIACPPSSALRLRGANTPEERAGLLRELSAFERVATDKKA